MTFLRLFIVLSILSVISACGGGGNDTNTPIYERITDTNLGAIPTSESEPIVFVQIGDADPIGLDMPALESLGLVQYRVMDMQGVGKEATFRGVLVSDLLAVVGTPESATTLVVTAHDDYSVTIPISDIRTYPVLLATMTDGERMTLDTFGPTRFVYPYGFYSLDASVYDARWIWSVKTIVIR